MKITQTYPAALIAIRTIDSEPQGAKSAIRGLIQRLGLAFLAFTLVIVQAAVRVSARLKTKDPFARSAIPLLTLSFRRMLSSEHPYSPKTEPS